MRRKAVVAGVVLASGAAVALAVEVLRPFDEPAPPMRAVTGAEVMVVPVGIPSNWERREHNGMPYYLIPLSGPNSAVGPTGTTRATM